MVGVWLDEGDVSGSGFCEEGLVNVRRTVAWSSYTLAAGRSALRLAAGRSSRLEAQHLQVCRCDERGEQAAW